MDCDDAELCRLIENSGSGHEGWSDDVVNALWRRIQSLEAIDGPDEIYAVPSFAARRLEEDVAVIRLTDDASLVVEISADRKSCTLIEIVDV